MAAMSRPGFLASGVAFFAAPLAAEAQEGKTFRLALRDLGYVEGRMRADQVIETPSLRRSAATETGCPRHRCF